MEQRYPELFKPAFIGKLKVSNRIVMAPISTNFAHTNGEVSQALIAHYATRARGGVGIIIVEAACVSTYFANQGPGQLHISSPRFILGLTRLNEAMKAYGSRTFIQLVHPGRQTSSRYCGGQPVAPSAIACPLMKEMPRELNPAEVKQIIQDFTAAAHYASQAGFDGVELHAAHGYLINQFLSPNTNLRADQYGGSLVNRQRFLLEIVSRIKHELPELVLSVRLNIDDFIAGGLQPEESLQVCRELEKTGVDVLDCSCGTYASGLRSIEPAAYEEGWRVYLAEAVKKVVNVPVITGGMIRSPEYANQVLAEGRADFLFMGRPLLADPDWVNKVRRHQDSDIRPCINCNCCIDDAFKGQGIRCTVNPMTGRETILDQESRMRGSAHALVIGGGPAGMQAVLSLRRHGLEVTLIEQKSELGGYMHIAAVPPHKQRIDRLREHMRRQVEQSGAAIILNKEADRDLVENMHPDVIVIATGSQPMHRAIPGVDKAAGFEAVDVLAGIQEIHDQEVVIIGGGTTGCEVAAHLVQRNKRVTILEKTPTLAADMERKNRRVLLDSLGKEGVVKRTRTRIIQIEPGQVLIQTERGEEKVLADSIIWATGFKSRDQLYHQLSSIASPVFVIGDAQQVRGFRDAISEGEMVGSTVWGMLR